MFSTKPDRHFGSAIAVSYTHLDVYKRQFSFFIHGGILDLLCILNSSGFQISFLVRWCM